MVPLEATIDALKMVASIFGTIPVPVVQGSLKSAAELACKICELVKTMKENREGYEQLGVQVAGLLTAVASVLQQPTMRHSVLERLMTENVDTLLMVLEEIKFAVEKRLLPDSHPVRTRDRIRELVPNMANNAKRLYKDQEELPDLRRKLQSVVDAFTVSSLLLNELISLQNGRDVIIVRDLASRILELQVAQGEKREIEARRIIELQILHDAKREAEAIQREAEARRILDLQRIQVEEILKRDAEAERVKRDADITLLDSLRPSASAAWNAESNTVFDLGLSMCTPGTRVSVLNDILTWAGSSDSPCVFWLNGLAGTGKSTIARTLCQRLHKQGRLGASFFISRDDLDRRNASNIVRSIAHQLAVRWRPVSDALCATLRETPISVTRTLQQQIADFIITPTRELQGDPSIIVVIDALDEDLTDFLGRPGGELLLLLVRQVLQLDGRLRLFLTSRAEIPIQHMFRELSATAQTSVVKLHELDTAVVQEDIITYLTHSFVEIRDRRPEFLLHNWPPVDDVHRLAELSGLLFVFAATTVRFINDRNYSPRHRLAQLLGHKPISNGPSAYGHLDALYRQILKDAVQGSGGDDDFLCQRLQTVVATIILAQTPLSIEALATLSGVDSGDIVIVVGRLSSLLSDSSSGLRFFHPSFPDFVIDAARCTDPRLVVMPNLRHSVIALRCLLLMNDSLRYDMCNLQDPNVANADVQSLDLALHENVPDALRYAGCSWCSHLAGSHSYEESLLDALVEFCRKHLFHWVELLSLVEHITPTEAELLKAVEWCKQKRSSNTTILPTVTNLLRDLSQTIQTYSIPIRSCALQIYHSAMVTMPQCMLLDTLMQQNMPTGLSRLVSPRAAHWGRFSRVLEGHSGWVLCVAYSPDGRRIASGSRDRTMRIWSAITFEQLAELRDPNYNIGASVAFSSDSSRIICGSIKGNIQVWNAITYERLAVLEGHQSWVRSIASSPNGTYLVSGSCDRTVRVWNAVTFEQLAELRGHEGEVLSVGFSPNSTRIVSGSRDATVRLWDIPTYVQLAELDGHRGKGMSVAFSPDGKHIISGSDDFTVRVWNVDTFELLAQLEGHQNRVFSVAYSPDGKHIISGSGDHTVRVWDGVTFKMVAELEGHHYLVQSVALSPDGTCIVSGSQDGTVRVWNAIDFRHLEHAKLVGHPNRVRSVAISPDGTCIISGGDDHTVRVWSAITFEQLASLDGHDGHVRSVAFSPSGSCFVSGSHDSTARVWNAVTFKQLAELKGHRSWIFSVACSPNGAQIASASGDSTLRIWNAVTFEQLVQLEGENDFLFVAFSNNGTRIASSSKDFRVRVWNAMTFEQLAVLEGHHDSVGFVTFLQEDQVIISRDLTGEQCAWICGSSDGTTWTKVDPAGFMLPKTCYASSSEMDATMSETGWLTCSYGTGHIMLWLPVERRGKSLERRGRRVVVGADSGAVTVLELPSKLD